jgi:glycosyltransferase involved in cell wall biosynthesis
MNPRFRMSATHLSSTFVINAINSNSAGGRTIRDNLLTYIDRQPPQEKIIVLAAEQAELPIDEAQSHIKVHRLPSSYARGINAPYIYQFALDRVLRELAADVVLNLGDLVIKTTTPQVYLFDWAYALKVHPKVWSSMTWPDWISRRMKLRLIRNGITRPRLVIAQTADIAAQLRAELGLGAVDVVGNAVDPPAVSKSPAEPLALPDGITLFVPSAYYPHKNLEILLNVAKLARDANKPYRFILTITPTTPAATAFLKSIDDLGLAEQFHNLGPQPYARMADIYPACDGVVLPTLLESFTLVYVEAMHYQRPMFTSDMWFAHGVCGDGARYFDPFDAASILNALDSVFDSPAHRADLVQRGSQRLVSFPSADSNGAKILQLMRSVAAAAA